MMAEPGIPILPPLEAIRFFRDKGFTFGFSWQDVWQEEHAAAFTVAKAMSRDVLETIRAAVDAAIADGTTIERFRDDLTPKLQALGWWGRKKMIDPLTAQAKTVQLGSPRRLGTIFRVNMRAAYQAGRWERIDAQKKTFPYLRYVSVMDGRERPQHHAWHDTVLPVDDPWWDTHYGPCDWECRCTAAAYNARQLARKGLAVTEEPTRFPDKPWTNKRTGEVHVIEEGIGPGWAYNVGKARLAGLAPPPMPDRFDGADTAAARAIGAELAGFFAAFDLSAEEARPGRVVVDQGGWPLAVSLAWFQQDGRIVLPAPARRSHLALAGRTLADPDAIGWVWVTARDGAAMLMRRYVALDDAGAVTCVVDVGRSGWRFLAAGEGAALDRLRPASPSWTRASAAIAGYDPHQVRDKGGRWASRHGSALTFVVQAVAGDASAAHDHRLGPISPTLRNKLDALGVGRRALSIGLDKSYVRHIVARHARDSRGQKPLRSDDIARAHEIIHAGQINHGNPRRARSGAARLFVTAKIGDDRYAAAFEVRRYRIVLTSLRRR